MPRESEILAQLSNVSGSVQNIATAVYKNTDPDIAMAAERNVAAHLEKLLSELPVVETKRSRLKYNINFIMRQYT